MGGWGDWGTGEGRGLVQVKEHEWGEHNGKEGTVDGERVLGVCVVIGGGCKRRKLMMDGGRTIEVRKSRSWIIKNSNALKMIERRDKQADRMMERKMSMGNKYWLSDQVQIMDR